MAHEPVLDPAFAAPVLDAERLDCYAVALEFDRLVPRLVPRRGQAELRDQLERASSSIVLNLAEGAGRFSPPDKARFFSMSRGSTAEAAAILDLLLARRVAAPDDVRRGRILLVRVVQMLSKLIARHATATTGP